MALCASCDRCRSSKTRCDRQHPCGFCKQKYMLTHRVTNVDNVDVELFGCVYSPAKRRGPVPGRSMSMVLNSCRSEGIYSSSVAGVGAGASVRGLGEGSVSRSVSNTSVEERGQPMKRRASGMSVGGSMSLAETIASNEMGISQPLAEANLSSASSTSSFGGNGNNYNPQMLLPPIEPSAVVMQQHILSNSNYVGMNMYPLSLSSSTSLMNNGAVGLGCAPARVGAASGEGQQQVDVMANAQNAAQQQLAYVQQLQLCLQMQAQKKTRVPNATVLSGDLDVNRDMSDLDMNNGAMVGDADVNLRQTIPATLPQHHANASASGQRGFDHPDIHKYLPLLHPSNPSGMHLRACYTLVFGGLLGLPPIPTNEEYCRRFGPSLDPGQLPQFDIAALHAARFAELAMGALTNIKHGDMTLLVALTNASVSCLRYCAAEKVHPSLMLDVARAYFFHAILRAHSDDMERYFKYRRICLIQLAQLDGFTGADTLMAAISYQDSLVYMIYNASEDALPDVDCIMHGYSPPLCETNLTEAEKKYGIRILTSCIASNPINQMWTQGVPPIFINELAPPNSRALDALACAIRSAVDRDKTKPVTIITQTRSGRNICRKRQYHSDAEVKDKSATEWAVEQHPDDLSSCNLLAQASSLLTHHKEFYLASDSIFCGLPLLVKATELVLDSATKEVQIHNIFTVLEAVLECPMYLFQFGPTYHIIHSCAIVLAQKINEVKHDPDSALFEKALSIYNGTRMVLENHRSKLPSRLQCRELPLPDFSPRNRGPAIDISNFSLCFSRNCSGRIIPDKTSKEILLSSNESEQLDANDQVLLALLSRVLSQEL
ncbi:hypothetical protein ACHAWU_006888 [Discostella pseudostelligera]|uniref:Zn(2)-C6 fungal-type domain-containing protein n=1 Tax=Discostella pseudostelligera TaxID=259834 RepID=A0ABD3N2L8_9STRA